MAKNKYPEIKLEDPKLRDTQNFYNAFSMLGQPVWSDDLLGKLLAWACCTGFREITTQRPMYDVLSIAAARFGIQGGKVPDKKLMEKYYEPRVKELQAMKEKTPWLPKLMERYKVKGWENYDYGW